MTRIRVRTTRLLAFAASFAVAGCGGGGDPLSPPTTGGIALTVSGLPSGAAASITLTGPGGFSRALTATTNLDRLLPGSYTLTAASVSAGATNFAPATASQAINVPASTSRVPVTVAYAEQNSQIVLTVSGLPGGTDASILVTNATGFSRAVTATTTIAGLTPGLYTIAAATVTSGADSYAPSPASQQVQVSTGMASSTSVAYQVSVPGTVNLLIDGVTMTQSVQSYTDTVPLVANRDAYLRVFVRADQANAATPAVRVRLYQGSNPTPVATYTIPAPAAGVPMTIDQGQLNSSWNQLLPAALVTPSLRILLDVDPGNGVPESNESDNSYPASGLQQVLDVRAVAPLDLHLVPVIIGTLTGDVTAANKDQFAVTLKKVMPLEAVTVSLRVSPFSSSVDSLPSGGSSEWSTVLNEVRTLQVAEGTGEYFYGVVKTSYGSGIAGIGYVPGKAAVGWDKLPSRDGVLAHEVGHNFSLQHAPCGMPGGEDPGFPYAGGAIGVWGLDVGSLTLKPPTSVDLMGYCGGINWISDYHYQKALNYRQNAASPVIAGAQAGLLVWGRIEHGVVTLEPAFEISAPAHLPARRGPYLLDGLDDRGRMLFSYQFEGELVADQSVERRQFAFVLPQNSASLDRLARLRVRGGGRVAERASIAAVAAQGRGAAVLQQLQAAPDREARVMGGGVRLRWNASAYPMAMVRDAATGDILAFARRGDATIGGIGGRSLDITWSDGVRSRRERVTPQ
jgi:hypothetical protein